MTVTTLLGDCREVLRTLPDASVQMCVTSPPYWRLRKYTDDPREIGQEATPAAYVAALVEVFREVRRVLRDDGTLWLNLGDKYSGSSMTGGTNSKEGSAKRAGRMFNLGAPRTNLADCIHASIEGGVLFIAARCMLTVTAHRDGVLSTNKGAPDRELSRLFRVQRITLKERNNDLSQVIYLLNPESYARLSGSVAASLDAPDSTNLEIVVDALDDLSIVISELNLDSQATLGIPGHGHDATDKGIPVHQSITLGDALVSRAGGLRNFSVRKASQQHLALALFDGRVDLRVDTVAHLLVSNQYGSLVRYAELYHQAERQANRLRPKQLIGLPWMVATALQEAGWILRAEIIWVKPNAMPESVTDRPTRAHEHVFLFSKRARYFYDSEAVAEKTTGTTGAAAASFKRTGNKRSQAVVPGTTATHRPDRPDVLYNGDTRNARTVWSIATQPLPDEHYAPMPQALAERCIRAGSRVGDTVLDPFGGSGTTGRAALKLGRSAVLIELGAAYLDLQERRTDGVQQEMFT